MVVRREEWTQGAVHEARGKDFLIAGFAFALGKTTRKTACSTVLLTIIYLQRHKISTRNCILCCTNSCEKHCVTHAENRSTISLFCNFSGLNCDGSSIRQLNTFCNYVHLKIKKLIVLSNI